MIFVLSACGDKRTINDKEYYFKTIDLAELWQFSKGKSQTIAFIDTGITKRAASLYKDRIVSTYNSIDDSGNVLDTNGHGTQTVSVAAGDGQGNVFGIAPKAKMVIIKAFEEGEQLKANYIKKAISYAIDKNVDIINLSFGSFVSNKQITREINYAINKGITVVASTGDYGNKDILFPANMKNVISVAAKDHNTIWELSNVSSESVVAFPGVDIKALSLGKKPVSMNGTSYSSALASGYIALLRDFYTTHDILFTNNDILSKLKELDSIHKKRPIYKSLFK
ncbi:S8 family serine peptidase [Listeria monocytogenes]|nr:S8 family serine peptidase [Listeria monocytogenes]